MALSAVKIQRGKEVVTLSRLSLEAWRVIG